MQFPRAFLRLAAAALIGTGVQVVATAQEPVATPSLRLGDSPERDFQLTVHARKALAETPGLSQLNLGIRVRRGVVFVWGPVPNQEMARQVVARLDKVKGTSGIESELYVGSGGEGVQAFSVPPSRGPVETVAAPPGLVPQPAPASTGQSPEQRITSRVLRMGGDVAANPAIQPAPVDPEVRIREVLRLQPKFGLMLYRMEGSVLVIQGGGDLARQMEFAQACSTIPGISRVRISPQ
jgi:hypothetical protein